MSILVTNVNIDTDVSIKIYEKNNLKRQYNYKNCIVNNGCNIIASLFSGSDIYSGIQTLQIGTGTNATTATSNALESKYNNGSVLTTIHHSGRMVTFQGIFSDTSRFLIREFGLFNGDTPPKMFSRVVTTEAVVKNSSETMVVAWTILFNPGC